MNYLWVILQQSSHYQGYPNNSNKPLYIGDGWGLIGFTTVIIGYDDDTMGLFGC